MCSSDLRHFTQNGGEEARNCLRWRLAETKSRGALGVKLKDATMEEDLEEGKRKTTRRGEWMKVKISFVCVLQYYSVL